MYRLLALKSIYVIAIISFFSFPYYNKLRFNAFFELLLILLFFLNLRKVSFNKNILFLLLLNTFYILTSLFYAIFLKGDNIKDFLMVYKAFIYLIIMCFFINKQFIQVKDFFKFFKFFLFIFLVKYLIDRFVFYDARPTLFAENNFELMFLILLFYLYYIVKGKVSFLYQGILSIIFLISGSISGILILLFILFIVNYEIIIKKIHFILPISIILFLLMISVIAERTGGTVDFTQNTRYNFFMVFLDETKDWSFLNFLVGSDRISSLSDAGCKSLWYWQELFSYKDDGTCYSVIFHSYLLRAIYDHGIIGLSFLVFFIYKIIVISGYKPKQAWVVLGIVLINGLSVSSFNSIYFILGIAFFLILDKDKLLASYDTKAFAN